MKTLSLRAKITLACFLSMFAILFFMYYLVTGFYSNSLLRNIDNTLLKDIAALKASLKFTNDGTLDLYSQPEQASLIYANRRNIFYQIRTKDGAALRRSANTISIELPYDVSNTQDTVSSIHFAGYDYRLYTHQYTSPDGQTLVLQVIRPLARFNNSTQGLSRQLFLLMPVPLVLITIAGWWIASRAMRPVNTIINTVQQINIDDLNTRLPVVQLDEIGRLASTFNDLFNRLEEAVSALKRFTADASHELRTPLTTIRTQAEVTLSRTRDIDNYKNSLGSILEDVEHLEYLIDTLLNLTRGDAGIIKIKQDKVNISALLNHWVENLQPNADEKGISIKTEIKANLSISGDQALLERIIVNLIDNAVNYTPRDGKIFVSACSENNFIIISVCDNGPGIADADKARIFARFVRLEKTRQNKRGTGLGLAIVQWAVKLHHGDIEVKDNGPGACFIVRFPVDASQAI